MRNRRHFVGSVHRVNLLDINKIEKLNAIEWIAQAIPINPDLLSRSRPLVHALVHADGFEIVLKQRRLGHVPGFH